MKFTPIEEVDSKPSKVPRRVKSLMMLIEVKGPTEDVLLVAGSAILISFAATVYPSLQAARLEPVAALRYE